MHRAHVGVRQLNSMFCDGYPTKMIVPHGGQFRHHFLESGATTAIFFIGYELFSLVFLFPDIIGCLDFLMLTHLLVFVDFAFVYRDGANRLLFP